MTAWVWVTWATRLSRSSRTSVCTTMVVRPTWSGRLVAWTVPSRMPRKKFVFDSIVDVVAPARQVDERAHRAERVGERHDHAAVQQTGGRAQLLAPRQAAGDLLGARRGQLDPEQSGERHQGDHVVELAHGDSVPEPRHLGFPNDARHPELSADARGRAASSSKRSPPSSTAVRSRPRRRSTNPSSSPPTCSPTATTAPPPHCATAAAAAAGGRSCR